MLKKSWEKVFRFRDNCTPFAYIKFSIFRREYTWSAVEVLKNSPEIFEAKIKQTKIDWRVLNWVLNKNFKNNLYKGNHSPVTGHCSYL